MSGPTVSVVIPVYNGEPFLWEALESVAWQTRPVLEIIAIDDGSTDRSARILECFPGVTILRQANAGVAAARNAGIAKARGEIIALLDADDIWTPDKLERQVAALLAEPDAGLCFAHHRDFAEPGVDPRRFVRPETFGNSLPSAGSGSWVVWRETLAKVGQFDPAFRVAEDADWLLRAREMGVTEAWVREVLFLRRLHGNNLTGNAREAQAALMTVLRASLGRRRDRAAAPEPRPGVGLGGGGTTE